MSDDDSKNSGNSDDFESGRKKGWEDLIFNTIERLAATPGKIKEPGAAFDWIKNLREDVQDRVKEEIAQRVAKIDWNRLARGVSKNLAENYELHIDAKLSWTPKDKETEKPASSEEVNESD